MIFSIEEFEVFKRNMEAHDSNFEAYEDQTGRTVSIENMCGGRYRLIDSDREVAGLTDDIERAYRFIKGLED